MVESSKSIIPYIILILIMCLSLSSSMALVAIGYFYFNSSVSNNNDSPPDPWAKVANKGSDSEKTWTGKIYDATAGDPEGTNDKRLFRFDGNVLQNAVSGKTTLDSTIKNKACDTQCYFYYDKGTQASKDQIKSAGLCDCTKPGNSRAI